MTGARAGRALSALSALLLLAALGACSEDPEPSPDASGTPSVTGTPVAGSSSLDGSTFTSTSVQGRDLEPGTTVEVGFEDGSMAVSAGCNTMFGAYDADGGTLAWVSEPLASMMACDPGLEEQDRWLTDLFTTGLTATSTGDTLTLTSDDVTLVLARPAEPDDLESLLGRTWTAIGTVSDRTTSRLPVGTRRPSLDVGDNGLARLFTGCRSGRTRVLIDGVAVEFANTTVQRETCSGPAATTDRAVLDLLDGAGATAELQEHLLVVSRDGEGMLFQIS